MILTINLKVDGRTFDKRKLEQMLIDNDSCIDIYDNCKECPFCKTHGDESVSCIMFS